MNEPAREVAAAIAAPAQARWSAPIPLSLVPAAAANLPDGKVLLWSADDRFYFSGAAQGRTYTSVFDPATGGATERIVTEADHNMFCPGTTLLPDGRLLVNGGQAAGRTSLYDATTSTWSIGAPMRTERGYNANTLLPDGSVLTVGGSWNGNSGLRKNAEVWTEAGGWRTLLGVSPDPMSGPDPAGRYRADNHMWLFTAANGRVLQAGPSAQMHWIDVRGNGSVRPAGPRGDDAYSMNGSAVMYEAGKILKTGGAPAYESAEATASSYVIDISRGVTVRKLAPMAYRRAFHNSVVLPNGQVLVVGGQTFPIPFSDDRAILVPELWDPVSERFSTLPPMALPRTYHSVALLLPDARVMVGGGGLCGAGCANNHPDVEILTPHYLLNADGSPASRPSITVAPARASYGSTMRIQTNRAVTSVALVRLSSATHSVNNDQRRIALAPRAAGSNTYDLDVPTNASLVPPGVYMLFALDADGVPSVARSVTIGVGSAPRLPAQDHRTDVVGRPLTMRIEATASAGTTIAYAATGLPPGLVLNTATGVVSGTPSTVGRYRVTVSAGLAGSRVSTEFDWTIEAAGVGPQPGPVRFVKLEQLSEAFGNPWSTMAEFNLLDGNGAVIDRSGWTVEVDSAEVLTDNVAADRAIDGNPATFWHTQYTGASPPPPHHFIVSLGRGVSLSAFRYLPRQDGGGNGTIANYRFYVSSDGLTWGSPVAEGNFSALGPLAAEKTVYLASAGNLPPSATTPGVQSSVAGQAVTLALSASDPNGDTLSFQATGLPPGLTLGSSSGVISGTPSTPGSYTVSVVVSDGRGASTTVSFSWTIRAAGTTGPVTARYVRLEQLSEINGNPWGSIGEFAVLDRNGNALPRTGWRASADSFDTVDVPANAIDGLPATLWHTRWNGASPPPPHWFVVDLGAAVEVGGFRYLPRQDGSPNGTIAQFRFYVGNDGVNWGLPVAQGDFRTMGAVSSAKVVMLSPSSANRPPQVVAPPAQTLDLGRTLTLAITATDPDGDVLRYAASGLPPGLTMDAASGVISGTVTTAGAYASTLTVTDGRGGSTAVALSWTVRSASAPPAAPTRYLRLVQLSEVNGNPWGSIGELNLLDAAGATLPRTGWIATADSSDVSDQPAQAIDGNPATLWHSRWSGAAPPPPHHLTIDMQVPTRVTGLRYLPRQDGSVNGTIALFRVQLSTDGITWGDPVAQGDFRTLGTTVTGEKTVRWGP